MRLRTPTPDEMTDLSLSRTEIKSPDQHHVKYQVKVITPIYGGGVKAGEPDIDMPIRATAIRGQLRFWWRLLQMHGPEKLSGTELFEKERAIWGGMSGAESSEDARDASSKVSIRVLIDSDIKAKKVPVTDYSSKVGLAYALFSAVQNNQFLISQQSLCFTLNISARMANDSVEWSAVENAIRWWASFGGIGARTRRGLGSISITSLESVSRSEAESIGARLSQLGAVDNPVAAWDTSVSKLRDFRQGEGVARNRSGRKFGRSFWPEPDSIREISGRHSDGKTIETSRKNIETNDHTPIHKAKISFPRAAFGLPIIVDFIVPAIIGEPYKTTITPNGYERMASPVIVKAVVTGEGKYVPTALILPLLHIESLKLEWEEEVIKKGRKTLEKKEHEVADWWSASKATDVDPIKNHKGTDALSAFLNYFGGR